jgi:hypothetical protein
MEKITGKISASLYLLKLNSRVCLRLFIKVMDRISGMAEVL